MIVQATGAAGSAVDASFVKVIPFLPPTHGVFSDGKCLCINTFLLIGCILQAPLYVSTLQGQRKQIWIQLLEKSLCLASISSDLLYLTRGLIDGFCYVPISQGGPELAKARHTTSDLGALHPHPISQALTWGSAPCRALPSSSGCTGSEAADSWQDGGGAGPSKQDSAPCPRWYLSAASPPLGPNGPDEARAFFLLFRWFFFLQFRGSKVHSVISLSPFRASPMPDSLPMLLFCSSLPGLTLAAQQGYGPHRSFIAAASVSTSSLSHQAALLSCVELLWEKE